MTGNGDPGLEFTFMISSDNGIDLVRGARVYLETREDTAGFGVLSGFFFVVLGPSTPLLCFAGTLELVLGSVFSCSWPFAQHRGDNQ